MSDTSSNSATPPHVVVERDGHVAIVRLSRPQAKNAITYQTLCLLDDIWNELDADAEVRSVVLTGDGGVFCAGGDLKNLAADDPSGAYAERYAGDPELPLRALLRMKHLSKPLLAAVEGPAAGGGMELVMATDIRVAGVGARFSTPEVKRGIFPFGLTVRVPRQGFHPNAMHLLLTGEPIDASEAHRVGLISHLCPDGEALAEALRIAHVIASNAPLAVQAVKRSVISTTGLPEDDALRLDLDVGWPLIDSADAIEGVSAFVEKRSPRFTGK